MLFLDFRNGFFAGSDTVQKVLHVAANCRGNVLFQVLFRLIDRVLLQLVLDVLVNGLSAIHWNEIVTHNAHLKSALVAINGGAPRVFVVVWMSPSAVLPDDIHVAEIEGSKLGIG